MNASTGLITGTLAAGDDWTWTPILTASDGTATQSATFDWAVASAITLAPVPDPVNVEGASATLTLHATDSTPSASLAPTGTVP